MYIFDCAKTLYFRSLTRLLPFEVQTVEKLLTDAMCENSGSGTGELIIDDCILMSIRYAYAFKVFCWIYVR